MNKTLQLLGLCKKAGKIVFGTDAVIDKLASKKVNYIFVANDASDATIDKIEKKAFFYECEINKSFSTTELNNATGLKNVKMIGISDRGFTKAIKKSLEVEEVEREKN